ncbi:MAG: DUF2892 domain-containing protein [Chitinispirillaceae bacterium]|nr:DUF2892 domain-containing protein [Chitinispirillaceae bacterium]
MVVNEGKIDRVIRAVLGILLLILGFMLSGVYKIIILIAAAILIITAITGFCGLYAVLGINTCKIKKTQDNPTTSG